MVIGEFGGLNPDGDNHAGAGHDGSADPQVGKTLLEHVADAPPHNLQEYQAQQQELSAEARHLLEMASKSPANFAQSIFPFLDKEIVLGNVARSQLNRPMSPDLTSNFSNQAGWGDNASQFESTLRAMGVDAALNNPSSRQGIDLYLKWVGGLPFGDGH